MRRTRTAAAAALVLGLLGAAIGAEAAWANPAAGFDKILFVKRIQYQSNHYYTDYINGGFFPGGNICILDLKTGKVTEVVKDLKGGVFGRFDLAFDADRIVFAWKGDAEEGNRIYECKIDGTGLRQLTFPPADEEELKNKYRVGYHHGTDDMDPCYLPDGGICFISTRCQYGILCDEPDIFTTTVLYRMDADGGNMEKLTNSPVSEATPVVMNDGRILYTRWEYVDKGTVSTKCLWAMRPNGSGSVEIYGNDIALPPTFTQGRQIPGQNNLFVTLGAPHCPQNAIGTVIRLDTTFDKRTRRPMTYMTPDVDIRDEGGFWFDGKSQWGRRLFKDPYPLSEKDFLVSMNPNGNWNDKTNWGLYLLNESGETTPIYSDGKIGCFMPMPLRPRTKPHMLPDVGDQALAEKGLAACTVLDVYHGMENVARGQAKYLRINEQVPRPWAARRRWEGDSYDQQHAVVSKNAALGLRVQHGIVPIEEDGSAYFVVPADRNIFFQVLDENFLEIQRERTYVNYRPGETRSCVGCHEGGEVPRGRAGVPLALRRAPSVPGPQPGEKSGARPLYYPADVQPVWDKHCIKCHGLENPKAGPDLSGTMTALFSRSYESLLGSKNPLLGPIIGENHPKTENVAYLPPKSLGSHTSVLVAMLSGGKVQLQNPADAERARKLAEVHKDVRLTQEEMVRVTTWVDANGQYYGSYWGRRNIQYKDHPNFRPVPTFETATSTVSPLPEDQR